MDDKRISKIEERADYATPGPWGTNVFQTAITTLHPEHQQCNKSYWVNNKIAVLHENGFIENKNCLNDLKFIAHARQDIPDLIAEIRRLNTQIADMTGPATATGQVERRNCMNYEQIGAEAAEKQLTEDVIKLFNTYQRSAADEMIRLAALGRAALQGYEETKVCCSCRGLYLSDQCYETTMHKGICVLRYFCETLASEKTKKGEELVIKD